ncbi:nuclear transport factor 2 family protein [Mycobacterium intracellulare]|uniref:nuclear transport factor 2 family protein n=1 Tax=Mycobacterium intracellulare TaxID=1767 RepID=UPI0034D2C75F
MSAHRDEDLLARVRLLEDERDTARLVASYGPLADAADSDGVANLWTEQGTYDVDGWVMRGRNEIRAMVDSPSIAHSSPMGPVISSDHAR